MRIQKIVTATIPTTSIAMTISAAVFMMGNLGFAASLPNSADVPAQMVITVRLTPSGAVPANLDATTLGVEVDRRPAPVLHVQRLTGDLADAQLFVLLDDSTRTSVLGVHIAELKTFLRALPPTTPGRHRLPFTRTELSESRKPSPATMRRRRPPCACRRGFPAKMAAPISRFRIW